MSDLPAFLRTVAPMQWNANWEPDIRAAADRIEALEAENAARIADIAALEFDVAALDELNITLEAECERLRSDRIEALEADNARLRAAVRCPVCQDLAGVGIHSVKPGQAVRPDGVVCDLVEATDETAAFTRSYVIDRITTDRAWILRPVALPEGGTS